MTLSREANTSTTAAVNFIAFKHELVMVEA
jgi:hypothetical protein